MHTVFDLPDDLLRRAKERAASDGITLEELVTRYVEYGLQQRALPVGGDTVAPVREGRTSPPALIPPSGRRMRALTGAEIEALFDEEDAADIRTGHDSA